MPKTSRKAKASARLMQRAIITITDKRPGYISLDLRFSPPVKGNSKMTAAISASMEMVQWMVQKQTRRDQE